MLKPSAEQKALFRRWFGGYRFVYNKTIDFKQEEYQESGKSSGYLAGRWRWKERLASAYPWITEIPAHTVYGAMQDADRDYQAVIRKRSQGTPAELPRCRRKTQRSCFILGNAITEKGIYPRIAGRLRAAEPLPHHPSDSRLMLDQDGRWYLSTPYKVKVQEAENQGVCALDPGVRTFITGVSGRSCFKIGRGAFGRIARLCHRLDDLVSRASRQKSRKKRAFRLAAGRARVRIRNLIDDLHFQAIGHLVRNFRTIVFPEANFTSAACRATRRIRSKTVRSLMSFAFARFRDRLKAKAEVMGSTVLTVCEAYTSKTANWTGEIVQNLGGSKTITSQGVRLDRDLNAALGILLKGLALSDRPGTGIARACTPDQMVTSGKEK